MVAGTSLEGRREGRRAGTVDAEECMCRGREWPMVGAWEGLWELEALVIYLGLDGYWAGPEASMGFSV